MLQLNSNTAEKLVAVAIGILCVIAGVSLALTAKDAIASEQWTKACHAIGLSALA